MARLKSKNRKQSPLKGKKLSLEMRRRIAEGTKRGQKPWRDGLRVLPGDIRAFKLRGQISRSLIPMVRAATRMIGNYAQDLGGEENLTTGQRVALLNLFRSMVAANGLYSTYLRTGKTFQLDQAARFANAELRALDRLGLQRRTNQVPSVHEYIEAATFVPHEEDV